MPVLKGTEAKPFRVKEGITRTQVHTENLMMVIIDFDNGPWNEPDPPHHHVHEQTSYVAEGEIIFLCEGEPNQVLKKGDMFAVPSGKPHAIQLLSEKARLIDCFNPIREDFVASYLATWLPRHLAT